jgi:hypothetical protein
MYSKMPWASGPLFVLHVSWFYSVIAVIALMRQKHEHPHPHRTNPLFFWQALLVGVSLFRLSDASDGQAHMPLGAAQSDLQPQLHSEREHDNAEVPVVARPTGVVFGLLQSFLSQNSRFQKK